MPADLDLIVKLSLAAVAAELVYRIATKSAPLLRRVLALAAAVGLYAFAPAVVTRQGGYGREAVDKPSSGCARLVGQR